MLRFVAYSFRKCLRPTALLTILLALAVFVALVINAVREVPTASNPAAEGLTAALRTTRLGLGDIRRIQPYGHYRVSVQRDGRWQEAARLPADAYLRTQEVTLERAHPGGNAPLRVRIDTIGGTNAHLDSVRLNGKPPVDSGWAPPGKLAQVDNDLQRVLGKPLELTFAAPEGDAPLRLALTGRMQGANMRRIPLSFPVSNLKRGVTPSSDFYSYTLGASPGRIVVDGVLEELGEPFFVVEQSVSPGYPRSPSYAWVRNDDAFLYLALDFTTDVTQDASDDYATVYADSGQGVKAFRVTPHDTRWGRAAYVYTAQVPWQHTLYEVAIPLAELGVSAAEASGTTLRLAFDA